MDFEEINRRYYDDLVLSSSEHNIISNGINFMSHKQHRMTCLLLNKQIVGCKTRFGTVVLGEYTDLSKTEAREAVLWLIQSVATAPGH